jgi:3-methylcrotonyl-CoA carboxylase alpha subunit
VARTVVLRGDGGSYPVTVADDGSVRVEGAEPIHAAPGTSGEIRIGARPARTAWVAAAGDSRWVFLDGQAYRFEIETPTRAKTARSHHGLLSAPMPATVVKVLVEPGDAVTRGDTLIILEAMKMELPVRATANGVVTAVRCKQGELVQPGESLIEIDEAEG